MTEVLISSADEFPAPITAKATAKREARRVVDMNMNFLLQMRAQCGMSRKGINGFLALASFDVRLGKTPLKNSFVGLVRLTTFVIR